MGQFLAMGIITKLYISKENTEKYNISLSEIVEKMEKNMHFAPQIYDFSENDTTWRWTLKKETLESELLNFLQSIYPLIFIKKDYTDYDEVLKQLSKTPADAWLKLAAEKSYESFQLDEYGTSERIYFDEKPFRPTITVDFESIALAIEGKIMMEKYGGLFNFFKLCIQRSFPDFQLSKSLRIYITG